LSRTPIGSEAARKRMAAVNRRTQRSADNAGERAHGGAHRWKIRADAPSACIDQPARAPSGTLLGRPHRAARRAGPSPHRAGHLPERTRCATPFHDGTPVRQAPRAPCHAHRRSSSGTRRMARPLPARRHGRTADRDDSGYGSADAPRGKDQQPLGATVGCERGPGATPPGTTPIRTKSTSSSMLLLNSPSVPPGPPTALRTHGDACLQERTECNGRRNLPACAECNGPRQLPVRTECTGPGNWQTCGAVAELLGLAAGRSPQCSWQTPICSGSPPGCLILEDRWHSKGGSRMFRRVLGRAWGHRHHVVDRLGHEGARAIARKVDRALSWGSLCHVALPVGDRG